MRRTAAFALLPLLALFAALVPAPAAARAKTLVPFRILPGPFVKNEPQEANPPTASRVTLDGVTVVVDLPGAEQRSAFVRTVDPKGIDPFAAPPGRPELFRTFLVTIQNASPVDVIFQPGNVILVTDRGEQLPTVDGPDLYLAAVRGGSAEPQSAIDRVAPLIFDSSTEIRSGARLTRLLVFGPLPERWKQFQIHFSYLQIGTETHTLSFIFHKQFLKD